MELICRIKTAPGLFEKNVRVWLPTSEIARHELVEAEYNRRKNYSHPVQGNEGPIHAYLRLSAERLRYLWKNRQCANLQYLDW